MISSLAKRIIRKYMRMSGPDIRTQYRGPTAPPTLFEHPLEALCYHQEGKAAAFMCPLDNLVDRKGLRFGSNGWHPFVETLRAYGAGQSTCYEDSILRSYYKVHQPHHAADSIIGFGQVPDAFEAHPPHLYYLSPWDGRTPAEIDRAVRRFTRCDNKEHGSPNLTLERHGFQLHGPVHVQKGRLEFRRLVRIYESIRTNGYDRRYGDVKVLICRHEGAYFFIRSGGGLHRTAAMAALGHEAVPARFFRSAVIDLDLVAYWPQVRNGTWSVTQAVAYIRHLLTFDSRRWAARYELVL